MSGEITRDQFFAQLDEAGEDLVRERLARSHYGDRNEKRAMVVLWLERKDQERAIESQRRNEASQAEQIDIARSAKDAAWAAAEAARVAAREAKRANMIATVAITIAVIAIAVSVLQIFVPNS